MPQRMPQADRENLSNLLLFCHERNLPLTCTGSQVIGGATGESDWDYVVYSNYYHQHLNELVQMGWERPLSLGASHNRVDSSSISLRLGRLNVIFTASPVKFNMWKRATDIAKAYAPRDKEQRIALFDAVFSDTPIREMLESGNSSPEGEVSEMFDAVEPGMVVRYR